ncbi:hypothetical protein [Lysinibacter cavernae]|uniref:hypothetical protein n=1 Tax=Lysinibacter cavernae TaxID=1640652 RepID=UPI00361697F8
MAKNQKTIEPSIPNLPQWSTRSKVPFTRGRLPGIDGSMWLVRSIPMSPIVDAKSVEEIRKAARPLQIMFKELARHAKTGTNRKLSISSYREFGMLLINIPTWYKAPANSKIRTYLNTEFAGHMSLRRELLFAVRMNPVAGGRKKRRNKIEQLRDAIDSVAETLVHGNTPLEDYDYDLEELEGSFARAGFSVPTDDQMSFADSWWNHGNAKAVPVLPHDDHIHYVTERHAKREMERQGIEHCDDWTTIPGQHAISYTSIEKFEFNEENAALIDGTDPAALWGPSLIDDDARVISIRGLIEPPAVTRKEIRNQKKKVLDEIDLLASQAQGSRDELDTRLQHFKNVESYYATGDPSPTIVNMSTIVGFDGIIEDLGKRGSSHLVLNPMENLQGAAWHETMLASTDRANPNLLDMPSDAVSFAGLSNLSMVGDKDGALMGFTERDGQAVYISPNASYKGDAAPLFGVFGGTGSGKTLLMLWLQHQWAKMHTPILTIDPKTKSDHTAAVLASGGCVYSLDDFVNLDGPLDPIRFSPTLAVGVQLAASMISSVNPFGFRMQEFETQIAYALKFGTDAGARATGEALLVAREQGIIDPEVSDPIFKMAESYPMFRATFGMRPGTESLSVADGVTLFKLGESSFELPPQNSPGFILADANPMVRTSVNVIRMMVRGGLFSLAGRGGVLNLDESWVVEKARPDELDEIGRLARSMKVLVALFTQRPSGPRDLGLKGYFSRGAVGHLKDEVEAGAALDLFNANSPEALERVKDHEFLTNNAGVNPNSLKALWEELGNDERRLLRPAVFYHADLRNSFAPVEVTIPQSFLDLASTNPDDIERRLGSVGEHSLSMV